jgi:hypothetical protein
MMVSNQTPKKTASRAFLLIALTAAAATTPVTAQQRPNNNQKASTTRLQSLTSGPTQALQAAIAGGATATAEILLTPVANNPTGPYGHQGYYTDIDISGQRLTVASGGGRTFWNMQIRNWGPALLRSWHGRIDLNTFLGAGADCGGGPGSCTGAADLRLAEQPCANAGICIQSFGELGSACTGGMCEPAWADGSRDDTAILPCLGFCDTIVPACGPFAPTGPNCFDAGTDRSQSRFDDGQTYYGATLAIDIPTDAKGLYTIGWVSTDTFFGDDQLPPQDIPIAAYIPGELNIVVGSCCVNLGPDGVCIDGLTSAECDAQQTTNARIFNPGATCASQPCCSCTSDTDCNDQDACTDDFCSGPNGTACFCFNEPKSDWNTETQCCDAFTGVVEPAISNECLLPICEFDGNRGRQIDFEPVAVGTPCTDGNADVPCTFDPICQFDQICAGTPVDDADISCNIDSDCRIATGVDIARCVGGWCVCSLDDQTGACCAPNDARGCIDNRIEAQCDCFGCVWTLNETCNTVDCSPLVEVVPAASAWTLAMLALTMLTGLAIKFRHSAPEQTLLPRPRSAGALQNETP